MKSRTKKLIVDLIFGAILVGAVIAINWKQDYPVSQRLCDGFFVAGVLLLGAAGMRFAKNQGAFDMITYSCSTVLYTAFPALRTETSLNQKDEDFIAYRDKKHERNKPCWDMLVSGGIYMALAVVLFVVYIVTQS